VYQQKLLKFMIIGLIMLAISGTAYAFAASNSVSDAHAGDGQGAISGYVVSNVDYSLSPGDPSELDSVSFSLDSAAAVVKVQLENGGSFFDCSNRSGNQWECWTNGQAVGSMSRLRVVAIGN
jgi:hypothetical protein